MTVRDLIEALEHCNPDAPVTARDQWEQGEFSVDALLYDDTSVRLLPGDD